MRDEATVFETEAVNMFKCHSKNIPFIVLTMGIGPTSNEIILNGSIFFRRVDSQLAYGVATKCKECSLEATAEGDVNIHGIGRAPKSLRTFPLIRQSSS